MGAEFTACFGVVSSVWRLDCLALSLSFGVELVFPQHVFEGFKALRRFGQWLRVKGIQATEEMLAAEPRTFAVGTGGHGSEFRAALAVSFMLAQEVVGIAWCWRGITVPGYDAPRACLA